MIYAAKVMALTAARVVDEPGVIDKIKEEHSVNAPCYDCPLPEGIVPKVVK